MSELDLSETYKDFMGELIESVTNRNHGFHILQFASLTDTGPTVRSVVLRRVELNPFRIYFHTHLKSPKVLEISRKSNCSIHAYCNQCKKQLRFHGTARVLTSGKIFSEQLTSLNASAARCYLTAYAPSTELEFYHSNLPDHLRDRAPTLQERQKEYENFGVLEFIPENLDALWLRAIGHVRISAKFKGASAPPQLSWLAP